MNATTDTRPMPPVDADVQRLRTPPHSLEAEQSVLGGLLVDNSAWDRVADLLAAADFYRLEHKLAFDAIGRLVAANKPADVITVHEELRRMGKDEDCGGLDYLNALAMAVPSASNARRYAEIVRERSVLRRLVAAADEIAAAALSPQGKTLAGILDAAEARILGIATESKRSAREPRPMRDLLAPAVDRINAACEGAKGDTWPTGVELLDRCLKGGFKPGKLHVLAARPSVGKSSFAMSLALHLAKHGHTTLFLSQEMPADELTDRALSAEAFVDGEALSNGRQLSDNAWGRITAAVESLAQRDLWIDDQPALTVQDIRAKARRIKGLRVLVVDYLQLCASTLVRENRTAQVGEISRGLKALAKELGITVLALSQLNREVEKRPGQRPMISDLRDSGEIEQDADAVLFLWPLGRQPENGGFPVGLEVAKSRGGPKGSAVMNFKAWCQRWEPSEARIEDYTSARGRGGDL